MGFLKQKEFGCDAQLATVVFTILHPKIMTEVITSFIRWRMAGGS